VTDHKGIAEIIARLDRDAIARELVERFRSEIAGYRRLPSSVVDQQILAIARSNVELCFETISAGAAPDPAQLEPFRASARARATEGMPLEDLLHAYRLGGRLGWRAIADAASPDERPALVDAAEQVMRYVDEVSAAVAQAYLDERQQLVSEEERAARDLFEAIIRDLPVSGRLEQLAELRGFELGERYQPFVARIPGSGGRRHADLAGVLRRDRTLALTEGDRIAGLLRPTAVPRGLPPQTLIVIGDAVARIDLATAVDEVRLIAELAERQGESGVVQARSYPLELLLLASPRHAAMVADGVIAPLLDRDPARGADLVATLEAFVEQDLDRRRTAAVLHIHPNTLDYRLRRMRELNDLDLRRPEAIARVVLALRQRRLRAH
jgi:DNA-binding PucR family transcriptional regulator